MDNAIQKIIPATHRVTVAIGTEQAARRVVDLLSESLLEGQAAIAAFERSDGRWDITMDFADAPEQPSIRELISHAAGDEAAQNATFDIIDAQDWVKASLEALEPVDAGRFVVHGRHDRERVAPNRIGIEIEAAMAFGTGHHGTTRGCLLALAAELKRRRPRAVLDVGTGTGVLAFAAAKALKRRVVAGDIDPVAIAVARDNARLNGIGPHLAFYVGPGVRHRLAARPGVFDLVMANILAKPLRRLAPSLGGVMSPDGTLILSGLLDRDVPGILSAYAAQGLRLRHRGSLEGWATLVLRRGGAAARATHLR